MLPEWWIDPPELRIDDPVAHYLVEVGEQVVPGEPIVLERPSKPVTLALIDLAGAEVRAAEALSAGRVAVDTAGIEPGRYVLRVAHDGNGDGGSLRARRGSPVSLGAR